MRWASVVAIACLVVLAHGGRSSGVPVDKSPFGIETNEVTNRVYVVNEQPPALAIIDGRRNKLRVQVPLAVAPALVAVNSATNRAYVNHLVCCPAMVSIVDGRTESFAGTIEIENSFVRTLAANPVSNRIYLVSVLD